MTLFEIVGLYVALNLFLLATLTLRVGMVRMKKKINLGDGGAARMNQRIRAHGNYTESAPFALIGLFILAALSAAPFVLHIFGVMFLIGRILHAAGMDAKNAAGKGRVIGMLLTMLTLLGEALSILYLIFT